MGGCGIGDLPTSNSGATAHRHLYDTRGGKEMTMVGVRNVAIAPGGAIGAMSPLLSRRDGRGMIRHANRW